MARTYNLTDLATPDVTNLTWARAWVRATLRDTPNEHDTYPEGSLHDEEIEAALKLNAVTNDDDTVLYAPHVTAAALVENDPTRVLSFGVGGLSESLPDAGKVAAAIRRSGAGIDALITAEGGVPPSAPGRTLRRATVY